MDAIYTINLSDSDAARAVLFVNLKRFSTYLIPRHGTISLAYENINRTECVIVQAALASCGIEYKACMRRTPVTPD